MFVIPLIVMMSEKDGWVRNSDCEGGLRSYSCQGENRTRYERDCERVMTTTTTLLSFAVVTYAGAAILIALPLCARAVPKWIGYLSFAHCSFAQLMLMASFAFLSANKSECWKESREHSASLGSSINGTIAIWVLYLFVLVGHYKLGKKIYEDGPDREAPLCAEWIAFRISNASERSGTQLLSSNLRGTYEPPIDYDEDDLKGARVRALYDCEGDNVDELSFKKNDMLQLLEREGAAWWIAKTEDGQSGLVPVNYLELPPP